MKLDANLLASALGCTRERAEVYTSPVAEACMRYAIDTPERMAMFLAQLGHESGSLRYVAELWGPTPAQLRYEGRADLGNIQPGDGQKFKGRGLIQITGRANYTSVRDRLRAAGMGDVPDFVSRPEALESPRWAALSAGDYWDMRHINAAADAGDFDRVTRLVNGGLNGIEDRRARWERAKAALVGAKQEAKSTSAEPTATQEEPPMLPFIAAALPSIVQAVPKLIEMFGSGSEVAQRNVKAAEAVVGIAQEALGAVNAQQVVETLAADPEAASKVRDAVESQWFQIVEAGGGGLAGAREADIRIVEKMGGWWRSPSFAALCLLMPLAYMIVGSVSGLWGYSQWSDDVRAAISTAVVSLIIGGAAGYYWGAATGAGQRKAP